MTTDTRAIINALEGSPEHGPISADARAIVHAINGSHERGPISTDARAIADAFLGSFVYGPISNNARAIISAIQGDAQDGCTNCAMSRDAMDIIAAINANSNPMDPNTLVTEEGEVITTESGEPIIID